MSIDNGVYILESPQFGFNRRGERVRIRYEYRITHCQAIENINDPTEGVKYQILLFGGSLVHYNKDEAILAAHRIAEKIDILEYGVRVIHMDDPFPTSSKE